ncbi:MAG: hypothetical protein ACTH7B_06770, partial [Lacticaseibacillus paracasei]
MPNDRLLTSNLTNQRAITYHNPVDLKKSYVSGRLTLCNKKGSHQLPFAILCNLIVTSSFRYLSPLA